MVIIKYRLSSCLKFIFSNISQIDQQKKKGTVVHCVCPFYDSFKDYNAQS